MDPKFAQLGPCMKKGKEIWFLERKRLRVGMVVDVDEAKDTITIATKGEEITMTPREALMFSQGPGQKKIKHRKQFVAPPPSRRLTRILMNSSLQHSASLQSLIKLLISKFEYTGTEKYAEKKVSELIEKLKLKGEFKTRPRGKIIFTGKPHV